MTKLIAVVGLPGSGKTETIEYLKKEHDWPNIYLGEATFDRLKAEGLEINQVNERIMREKIREELGMAAYAILAMDKIKEESSNHDIITLESLYSWEEYITLKEKYEDNFKVIAVFASPKIREERLKLRPIRPLKTREEFTDRDYSQIINLKQAGPIARADYTIINEDSLSKLHNNIKNIIKKIIVS